MRGCQGLNKLACNSRFFHRSHVLCCRSIAARQLASSTGGGGGGTLAKSHVWERQAIAVKNTDVENPYLEAIRAEHDPSLHLKTIEDELKGTIGKALGKQGEKILYAVQQMDKEYQKYEELLETHDGNTRHRDVIASATKYNEFQKAATKARWELLVHRQAAGFIVNNHQYVYKSYPIANPIPIPKKGVDEKDEEELNAAKKEKKEFGDQLDWWQRVGRWR